MADILSDGNWRVSVVDSIANQTAPTVAELNAGTLITDKLTKDGLIGFKPTTNEVDNSSLASVFDTVTVGRAKFSGTMLRLKKQSGTDTVRTIFENRGATKFIVVRRWVAFDTAWAATQKCSVYPITVGDVGDMEAEADTVSRYEVATPISSPATLHATVA